MINSLAFILGVSLSMDALAVSCTIPVCVPGVSMIRSLRVALSFGFFQAVMPLIGWFAAERFLFLIEPVDHWLGFILLSIVGGKMIREGLAAKKGCSVLPGDPTRGKYLLALSIGTSIDALAVGVSFIGMKIDVFTTVTVIGLITFSLSFIGLRLSRRLCGDNRTGKMEVIGGLVLILIGINIVLEHLGIFHIFTL